MGIELINPTEEDLYDLMCIVEKGPTYDKDSGM